MTLPFNDSVDIQKFFDSEKEWKNRLGYSWTGTKFLGKGAAGVTALWEYRGLEEYKPPLTQVVVKMSQEVYDGLQDPNVKPKDKYFEGEILERLSGARNGHIVRIFGGNRLGDRFGELGDTIKILLEFCPGGNLDRFLPQSMPEQAEVGETGLEEVGVLGAFFYFLSFLPGGRRGCGGGGLSNGSLDVLRNCNADSKIFHRPIFGRSFIVLLRVLLLSPR